MKEKSALVETASRNEALKRFARVATQKFNETLAKPIDAYTTLQDLVEPLKEDLLPQNNSENQVDAVLEKLEEILKKLLVLKHDHIRRHEGSDDK
jgi:seryl-tRNA synthetase